MYDIYVNVCMHSCMCVYIYIHTTIITTTIISIVDISIVIIVVRSRSCRGRMIGSPMCRYTCIIITTTITIMIITTIIIMLKHTYVYMYNSINSTSIMYIVTLWFACNA